MPPSAVIWRPMNLLLLFGFSALMHGYVGARLVPSLFTWGLNSPYLTAYPPAQTAWLALSVLLTCSAVCIPLGILALHLRPRRLADGLGWAALLFMGLFSSLLVLTVARDLLLIIAVLVRALSPELFDWPTLAGESALIVVVLALTVTVLGFINARRTAAVVLVDVPIANLPDALHGFTIAQISDIHVGTTIKRGYVDAIVRTVNRLDADMVAVTGDLVDGSVADLAVHVAPLAELTSRHGTFFVTGNHEYYSGVHAWIRELRRLDMTVLLNQHVVIEHDSAALVVAGVADSSAHHFDPSHRSDPHAAVAGAPAHIGMRLLLAHQPRSAAAAADAGFQLQLSGHTHGGQFLPWTFLVRLQQPFTAGLHKLRDLWVYTSRGTGYWGPPKRFGAPSEITKLRLVRAMPVS